jgi:isoleucyl-tRNA synthetase
MTGERHETESQIRKYWHSIDLLSKLEDKNADGEPYFLLDGPPYANNQPHIGHFRNTVYKDVYIRYAQLCGKDVLFQPGFDSHGLPVENMVQKENDIVTKADIEEVGTEAFVKMCREHATKYIDTFTESYDLLGSWYAWKEPYITYENDYIESVWATFKRIWDKGLVYQGRKPVYWCPVDQTTMAGYEVTDAYEMVEDPMVVVKFKRKDRDEYFTAYTTTPWTLPSNTFLAVHPEETYVRADTKEGTLILAEERLELLEEIGIDYDVTDTFPGKDLDGARYEPIIDCEAQRSLAQSDKAHRVYMSIPLLKERVASKTAEKKGTEAKDVHEHFVTTDSGTGIVHSAPGHGKTDYEVGQHYNVPLVSPLNDACEYTEDVEPYQGVFVKDADDQIVEDLEDAGSLLYTKRIQHKYPVSWRSKAPLIFRLSDQWFFDVQSIKQDMLDYNEEVDWQPDFAYERFKNWVEGAEDWNFTRQRYWGIPVPIFTAEDGDSIAIGSKEELLRRADQDLDDDHDLHAVNHVTITENDKTYEPLGDVFDVWFDSGNVPYGSLHYPFENKEELEARFPVSRINEAQDQIRGWFYYLMYVAAASMDKPPYEKVSMTGWVMNKDGEKLSKSKGNFKPVPELVERHGADNIRLYYSTDIRPSSEMKFNEDTIQNETSNVLNTLENLVSYLETNLDEPFKDLGELELETVDKWVLSRAASTTTAVREGLESFEIQRAGQALSDFVLETLSRQYVQLTRERSTTSQTPTHVLGRLLLHATKLLAPFTPHQSEATYKELKQYIKEGEESVHLERIPTQTEPYSEWSDPRLEQDMAVAQRVISAGLAARDSVQRGMRRPVKNVYVSTTNDEVRQAVTRLESVVKQGVNARNVVFEDIETPTVAEPHFRSIGKDHQEDTQRVASIVKQRPEALREAQGKTVQIDGFHIHSRYYELSYEEPEGYGMGVTKDARVYIDEETTPELHREGLMKEVLRRVQVQRKNLGLDREDRVRIAISGSKVVEKGVEEHLDFFNERAGSAETVIGQEVGDAETYEVSGETFSVAVTDV